jgi:hypothetical protein
VTAGGGRGKGPAPPKRNPTNQSQTQPVGECTGGRAGMETAGTEEIQPERRPLASTRRWDQRGVGRGRACRFVGGGEGQDRALTNEWPSEVVQ